jgi:hypothetical protein
MIYYYWTGRNGKKLCVLYILPGASRGFLRGQWSAMPLANYYLSVPSFAINSNDIYSRNPLLKD